MAPHDIGITSSFQNSRHLGFAILKLRKSSEIDLKVRQTNKETQKHLKRKIGIKTYNFSITKSKFKKHACQNVFAMKTSSPEQRHVKPNWCWIKLRRSNGIWWLFHKNISNGYKFLKSARTLSKPPAPPPPS